MSATNKTIAELVEIYIAGRMARREITPKTARDYRYILQHFCGFVGRQRAAQSIVREDVEAWMAEQARRVAISTYRKRCVPLRVFFTWALEREYVKKDPMHGVQLPRKPRAVPRGLRPQEVGAAIAYAQDTRERLMISLEVREGLRAMEVAAVEYADIDFTEHSVFIKGKGGHERVIPLTDETLELVNAYAEEERGRGAGKLIQSRHKSVWNDRDGVKPDTVIVLVGKAMKRAGVLESGHALRHTFAYGLVDAGAPVRDIQLALGHESLITTQIYLPRARLDRLRQYVGKTEYHLEMASDISPEQRQLVKR